MEIIKNEIREVIKKYGRTSLKVKENSLGLVKNIWDGPKKPIVREINEDTAKIKLFFLKKSNIDFIFFYIGRLSLMNFWPFVFE